MYKVFKYTITIICIFLLSCDNYSYKPPFFPVKIVINKNGEISLEGDVSIITLVGTFSLEEEYTLKKHKNSTIVIIRNKFNEDTVYRVHSDDKLNVVTDGETAIMVEDREILIDISHSSIKQIEFERVKQKSNEYQSKPQNYLGYKPYAVTKWFYNSGISHLNTWIFIIPIGFLWFIFCFIMIFLVCVLETMFIIVGWIIITLASAFITLFR